MPSSRCRGRNHQFGGSNHQQSILRGQRSLAQPKPDLRISTAEQRGYTWIVDAGYPGSAARIRQTDIRIDDEALDFLCDIVEGDARRALSALELAVTSTLTRPVHLTLELARESIQKKTIQFDATGINTTIWPVR